MPGILEKFGKNCILVNFTNLIEVLRIAQLLALVIFVSVVPMIQNLKGLRENLKHKTQILVIGYLKIGLIILLVHQQCSLY